MQEDKFIGQGKARKDIKVKMKHVNEMMVSSNLIYFRSSYNIFTCIACMDFHSLLNAYEACLWCFSLLLTTPSLLNMKGCKKNEGRIFTGRKWYRFIIC